MNKAVAAALIVSIILSARAWKQSYWAGPFRHYRPLLLRVLAAFALAPLMLATFFASRDIPDNADRAVLVAALCAFIFWRYLSITRYVICTSPEGFVLSTAFRRRIFRWADIAGYHKDARTIVLTLVTMRQIRIRKPIVGFNHLHRALLRGRFIDRCTEPIRSSV